MNTGKSILDPASHRRFVSGSEQFSACITALVKHWDHFTRPTHLISLMESINQASNKTPEKPLELESYSVWRECVPVIFGRASRFADAIDSFFLWYLSSYIHYARITGSLSHIAESVPSLCRVDGERKPRWMSRISRCFRAIGDTLPPSDNKLCRIMPNCAELSRYIFRVLHEWTRHNLSIRLYGHGVTGSLKKCARSLYGETTSRQNERLL